MTCWVFLVQKLARLLAYEKNPVGDNFVDFGMYDMYNEKARDFVNGYERTILLDFNVDGNILDMI